MKLQQQSLFLFVCFQPEVQSRQSIDNPRYTWVLGPMSNDLPLGVSTCSRASTGLSMCLSLPQLVSP